MGITFRKGTKLLSARTKRQSPSKEQRPPPLNRGGSSKHGAKNVVVSLGGRRGGASFTLDLSIERGGGPILKRVRAITIVLPREGSFLPSGPAARNSRQSRFLPAAGGCGPCIRNGHGARFCLTNEKLRVRLRRAMSPCIRIVSSRTSANFRAPPGSANMACQAGGISARKHRPPAFHGGWIKKLAPPCNGEDAGETRSKNSLAAEWARLSN